MVVCVKSCCDLATSYYIWLTADLSSFTSDASGQVWVSTRKHLLGFEGRAATTETEKRQGDASKKLCSGFCALSYLGCCEPPPTVPGRVVPKSC